VVGGRTQKPADVKSEDNTKQLISKVVFCYQMLACSSLWSQDEKGYKTECCFNFFVRVVCAAWAIKNWTIFTALQPCRCSLAMTDPSVCLVRLSNVWIVMKRKKCRVVVFRVKVGFLSKKVCYKVSLCENCQQHRYKAFTGLPSGAQVVCGGRLLLEVLGEFGSPSQKHRRLKKHLNNTWILMQVVKYAASHKAI